MKITNITNYLKKCNAVDYIFYVGHVFKTILHNHDYILLCGEKEHIFIGKNITKYKTINNVLIDFKCTGDTPEVIEFVKDHVKKEYDVYVPSKYVEGGE